jgi:hypothetical protein
MTALLAILYCTVTEPFYSVSTVYSTLYHRHQNLKEAPYGQNKNFLPCRGNSQKKYSGRPKILQDKATYQADYSARQNIPSARQRTGLGKIS